MWTSIWDNFLYRGLYYIDLTSRLAHCCCLGSVIFVETSFKKSQQHKKLEVVFRSPYVIRSPYLWLLVIYGHGCIVETDGNHFVVSWEPLGQQGDQTSQSCRKSTLYIHWKDWCWSWNSNTLATWYKEPTHWKWPWCWERLKAGGEGDDRGWDSWMASLTQQTWV